MVWLTIARASSTTVRLWTIECYIHMIMGVIFLDQAYLKRLYPTRYMVCIVC